MLGAGEGEGDKYIFIYFNIKCYLLILNVTYNNIIV